MKYTATSTSGKVFTRKSERTYTHAVIMRHVSGHEEASFSGSLDLANKAAASKMSMPKWWDQARYAQFRAEWSVEVVEVVAQ